ncbi:MAG: hypothetical protein GY778_06790, partial [bacterium]|nr:hypothetical protein [bacterium]
MWRSLERIPLTLTAGLVLAAALMWPSVRAQEGAEQAAAEAEAAEPEAIEAVERRVPAGGK